MAELVIADAPHKVYPGGVIALWCKDWLAGARGSLTTELDALSCTGEIVRDTQQVATDIVTAFFADPYNEALDTLEIPFSGLPIEQGLTYRLYVSHRLEGDWDITQYDAGLSRSYDTIFNLVCQIGAHGGAINTLENPSLSSFFLRNVSFYSCDLVAQVQNVFKTDTITIRAYSQVGTTLEWLLDQIVMIPAPFGSTGGWTGNDFFSSSPDIGTGTDIVEVDGADGFADDGGKFTLIRSRSLDRGPTGGSGDYQRKSNGDDAEYLSQVSEADFLTLWNSTTDPDSEPSASHAYTLHRVHYRPSGIITRDEFNRSPTPPNLGITPEGFGWNTGGTLYPGGGEIVFVDSGVLKMKSYSIVGGHHQAWMGQHITTHGGARVALYDQATLTGKFRIPIELYPTWRNSPFFGGLGVNSTSLRSLGDLRFLIEFEHRDRQWRVRSPGIDSSWHSVSSWYADGDWVRFKVEHRRHLLRVKFWEDGTAEPGTWGWSNFIREDGLDYPYGDDPDVAMDVYSPQYFWEFIWQPNSYGHSFGMAQLELWWDDIQIERESYGENPQSGYVRLESPDGNAVGEIEIPYGATYFVSWGKNDYTTTYNDGYDDYSLLLYSLRTWNDITSPEMQAIDTLLMWFRSVHRKLPTVLRYR